MTQELTQLPSSLPEVQQLIERSIRMRVDGISSLRAGTRSQAWKVRISGEDMVLRISHINSDFLRDQHAARYASTSLPIPKVRQIGEIEHGWWCISDFVAGEHLDDLDVVGMRTLMPDLVHVIQTMHSTIDTETTGWGTWDDSGNGMFPSFGAYLNDVYAAASSDFDSNWRQIVSTHPEVEAVFENSYEAIQQRYQFIPDTRQLVHSDLLNFNVRSMAGSITGIFDWGCAMWGDGLYDLAWFRFWLPWYPQWVDVDFSTLFEYPHSSTDSHITERMECYLLHIGMAHIRYYAKTGNIKGMIEIGQVTETILSSLT